VVALAAVIIAGIVIIVGFAAVQWRKYHEAEAMADLKRDLAAQGKSPEEIDRILKAGNR
jgi:hypothetical protein